MLKISISWRIGLLALVCVVAAAPGAIAVPMTYAFDSGTATLTVVLDDGSSTNVLDLTTHPTGTQAITLDGSQVTFDPAAGSFGTLLSLTLTDAGPINLDLDQGLVALDTVSIINAVLANAFGATGVVSDAFGSFFIDTTLDAVVSGVFPDTSTFGPVPISSGTSAASGVIGVSGSQISLGIFGVNIATFAQIGNPDPLAPDIILKADFQFFGTLVPEPGTALLLGMGLIGLGSMTRRY